MPDTPPIACTLDSAQLRRRESDIASLARAGLLAVEREARRVVLRFRPEEPVRRRVAEIAAAEAACCAFLTFGIDDEPTVTVLTITAPAGGEAALQQLADAFAAGA
jgi:hypothetical protein